MDKVKTILAFLYKYHFWFVSALTVVVILICWWYSTGTLAKQFQNSAKAIEEKFSGVKAIGDGTQHPNQQFIDAVKNKNEELKKGVGEVWGVLYREQKNKNPWPALLGSDFVEKINSLGPEDNIPNYMREKYQNFIKDYFPALFKIVNLRHTAETADNKSDDAAGDPVLPGRTNPLDRSARAAGRNLPTGSQDSASMVGVVDWDLSDRSRLQDRFDWSQTPQSLQVRLAQEDLWVYETLLRVINETNEGASEQSQAAVKRIEALEIGGEAVNSWTESEGSVYHGTGTASSAATAASSTEQAHTTPASKSAASDRDLSGQNKEELLKNRYVDDKGSPLAADAPHPYAEFKMMPINMKLQMDQRKITKLLVECANRSMPIEVRRVRFRPSQGEALDLASMTIEGSSTSTRTSSFDRGTLSRGADSSRLSRGGLGSAEIETSPYDIPVEIQGIIYIYNIPDQSKLGTGTAGDKSTETAPSAAPTAAPAPAGGAGNTSTEGAAKTPNDAPATPSASPQDAAGTAQ